jgi:hypothetical protein
MLLARPVSPNGDWLSITCAQLLLISLPSENDEARVGASDRIERLESVYLRPQSLIKTGTRWGATLSHECRNGDAW